MICHSSSCGIHVKGTPWFFHNGAHGEFWWLAPNIPALKANRSAYKPKRPTSLTVSSTNRLSHTDFLPPLPGSAPHLKCHIPQPPITRLSDDVLQSIFEIGTWGTTNPMHARTFPLRVSHVACSWRTVALNTPTLWTMITMSDRRPHSQFLWDQECVKRSRDCPLTVFLDLRIQSWGTLAGSASTAADVEILRIMHPLQTQLSRVRSFTLIADDLQTGHQAESSLKTLSLLGTPVDWSRWNCNQLVHLSICYLPTNARPSVDQLRAIVASCAHNLQSLEIQAAAPVDTDLERTILRPEMPEEVPIILPHVKVLTLGFVKPFEAVLVLRLFAFPVVRELTIRDVVRSLLSPQQRHLSSDASPILRALVYDCMPLPSIEILTLDSIFDHTHSTLPARFICSFPRLSGLILIDCSRVFLQALSVAPSTVFWECDPATVPALICRSLRHLTTVAMNSDYVESSLGLRSFQAAMKGIQACLQSLSIYELPERRSALAGSALPLLAERIILGRVYRQKSCRRWDVSWGPNEQDGDVMDCEVVRVMNRNEDARRDLLANDQMMVDISMVGSG
ncbi:hypothetical protein EW146_g7806 [Bondarzewia mesenterica]|uniref:F-box domain-containing protein n=1 Tax=Bondarzewia mesenterica TaxID=1095465 RepID=A0A4S4LJV3_9AGAM|nr:hypothetical protein EW146_g7806 [Bondarzewia mesenterica]